MSGVVCVCLCECVCMCMNVCLYSCVDSESNLVIKQLV